MSENDDRLQSLRSNPPINPSPGVNQKKLLEAWGIMTDVNRDLVEAIRRNEQDNVQTRYENRMTRRIVMMATWVGVLLVASLTINNYMLLRSERKKSDQDREVLVQVGSDSANTLTAVRKVAEAVGAKVEADAREAAAVAPFDDEKGAQAEVVVKALEAQEAALRAEQEVTRDPAQRRITADRLDEVVKAKAEATADPPIGGRGP